jgi:hypothetical protein
MRQPLAKMLTSRYPGLYGPHAGHVADEDYTFGFETGDGWFSILDALSEVLVWRAEIAGRPLQRVRQVKEKFGTLRYYWGDDEADDGAIDMAEELSGRFCEATGRPGRLGERNRWFATRAPGVDGFEPVGLGLDKDGKMRVPPIGFTSADVVAWRADVLTGVLDVPPGWLDLVDGLLLRLSSPPTVFQEDHADTVPVRVGSVGRGANGDLRVDHVGGGQWAEGVVAMAVAMARRVDPDTGAAGPVDDSGTLIGGRQ